MSVVVASLRPDRSALLTRVAPVTRITVGACWLLVAVLTVDPVVPARLLAIALACLVLWSGLPLRAAAARLSPLLLAALGLAILTALVHPANGDRSTPGAVVLGPLVLAPAALSAAAAIGLRLATIAVTSLLVLAPSDPTRLTDSLVQQWRIPDRFAFVALAALRVAPLFARDWAAIGAARRVRGIEPRGVRERVAALGDRLLVLLVAALRRAERLALAMDSRGFDSGQRRSHYRPVRLSLVDWVVLAGGLALGVATLVVGR